MESNNTVKSENKRTRSKDHNLKIGDGLREYHRKRRMGVGLDYNATSSRVVISAGDGNAKLGTLLVGFDTRQYITFAIGQLLKIDSSDEAVALSFVRLFIETKLSGKTTGDMLL